MDNKAILIKQNGAGFISKDINGAEIFNDYIGNSSTGKFSHVEGYNNITNIDNSHVEGVYNSIQVNAYIPQAFSLYIANKDTLEQKGIIDSIEYAKQGEIYAYCDYTDFNTGVTQTSIYIPISYDWSSYITAINNAFNDQNVINANEDQCFLQIKLQDVSNLKIGDSYNMKNKFGKAVKQRYGKIVNVNQETNEVIIDGEINAMHRGFSLDYDPTQDSSPSSYYGLFIFNGGEFGDVLITDSQGLSAHAEGIQTIATVGAHSEGYQTKANEFASHAEGAGTISSGWASHAEGSETIASGHQSHAEGQGTKATMPGQHVQGKWNKVDSTMADIVGNGTSDTDRSNAYALDWEGNGYFAGNVFVDNGKELATKKYVDDAIGDGGGSYSDWSEEDKQAIINDVLASLPDADTMSFPLEETISGVSEE